MNLLTSLWHGGLIILPIIGLGVAAYCGYRWSQNKSWIALSVGTLFLILSIAAIAGIISDK
jgi:hypothetical protein